MVHRAKGLRQCATIVTGMNATVRCQGIPTVHSDDLKQHHQSQRLTLHGRQALCTDVYINFGIGRSRILMA